MARDWCYEISIVNEQMPTCQEGDIYFHRGGFVHLGNSVFPWTERIEAFEFYGNVATRDSSGVLTITTPTGQAFCYRFDPTKDIWYRRVPREAPLGLLATWRAEWRLCEYEYGFMVGTLYYVYKFVAAKMLATYFTVGLFAWTVCVVWGVRPDHLAKLFERPTTLVLLVPALLTVWIIFFLRMLFCYAKQLHRLSVFGIIWSLWWGLLWMWPCAVTLLAAAAYFWTKDPEFIFRFKESFTHLMQTQVALLLDF